MLQYEEYKRQDAIIRVDFKKLEEALESNRVVFETLAEELKNCTEEKKKAKLKQHLSNLYNARSQVSPLENSLQHV